MPAHKYEVKRIALVPHTHDSTHDADAAPERVSQALAEGWEPVVQWNSGGTLLLFLRRPLA